ncbi:MAG: polyketide antibiotic transporter, partial [Leifsonia sp.]
LSAAGVLVATGLASAVGFVALGNWDNAWLSLGQCLIQGPAALTFVGAAALLVGLLPRLAIALGWGVFALGVGVGLFGGLLGLSDEVQNLSPIAKVPTLPTDDWVPTVVVAAIAVALVALAAFAFRRRDVVT